jgi:cell division protein FtsW
LAIGSGGLFGRGIGKSLRKFQYLPEVAADSIFPVIAEELGFFFVIGFIILLFLIASRGLMISKKAPDQFGRLLSAGIIIWFVFQSFLNIGAMVGLVPLTGIPLPFVSYGGTSLVVAMTALGILINISKQVKR